MPATEMEIIIPHVPDAGPVTAVKNVLIQSSLAQLQDNAHYERYRKLIDPKVLEELTANLGPGWVPIALADQHYAACDLLNLTTDEIANMGNRVGDRVQERALVAPKAERASDFDLWTEAVRPLHRVWPRIYQGGSVQIVKVAPKTQQCELRGFSLVRHRYFRTATLSAMSAAHAAMGARIESTKVLRHDAASGELVMRMSWS